MPSDAPSPAPTTGLSPEESRSLTSEVLELSPETAAHYRVALRALGEDGVPFVVGGLYALNAYTGVHRKTKDLDLLLPVDAVLDGARSLKRRGFRVVLAQPHWLAKAEREEAQLDLIFGLGNGLHLVDPRTVEQAPETTVLGESVRVDPPEDLILHRLFIMERHRHDMADVAHLILHHGPSLDWEWLLERVGEHWRLLLSQMLFFDFAYPEEGCRIPREVRKRLLDRAREALEVEGAAGSGATVGEAVGIPSGTPATSAGGSAERICQGTLVSRFSFAVDVDAWGFRDYRADAVAATRALPRIREVAADPVWDEVREAP